MVIDDVPLPAGRSRAETPLERSEEEAQLRPAESEVPGTEIKSPIYIKKRWQNSVLQ
jgi:hypothetical protein